MSGPYFDLMLDAMHQRLDRLEAAAGITDKVPADKALDAMLERDGLERKP